MASGVKAAIREQKCKKLRKQLNGEERLASAAIIRGDNVKGLVSKDPAIVAETEIRTLYYSMLDRYYGKSGSFSYAKQTEKSKAYWSNVVAHKERAGVSAEVYIKAQFEYFDKTFKCAPLLPHLITEAAIIRANTNYVPREGAIVSGYREVKSDKVELLRYFDTMIRSILKAQKITKEEFYRNFVMTGSYSVSPIYLDNCPIWQKMQK